MKETITQPQTLMEKVGGSTKLPPALRASLLESKQYFDDDLVNVMQCLSSVRV